ncbi:MAG TPA: NAD(P)H-binding protein [Kofleriaceae bacterium]|nr:NAD(P)H-binding protein [Kofleriaceae bacterium]
MTRAFVAGATGHVGRRVVAELRAAAVETIAHVRPDSARVEEWRAKLAPIDTTPWELGAMTETLARIRPTHVLCLIGTTRKQAARANVEGDPYLAIDVGLTKLLVDACVASGAAPRLVLLSSVGVKETARSKYMHAKWLAEEAVRGSGLPWIIARPSMIAGGGRDEGRPFERAGIAVAGGLLAVAGVFAKKTAARYQTTDADRLAAALARVTLDGTPDTIYENEHLR